MHRLLLHVALFLKRYRFDRQFISYSCLGHWDIRFIYAPVHSCRNSEAINEKFIPLRFGSVFRPCVGITLAMQTLWSPVIFEILQYRDLYCVMTRIKMFGSSLGCPWIEMSLYNGAPVMRGQLKGHAIKLYLEFNHLLSVQQKGRCACGRRAPTINIPDWYSSLFSWIMEKNRCVSMIQRPEATWG